MRAVAVDLADDRFDVRYDPASVDPARILNAVRELGYEPELVAGGPAPRPELARVDPSLLPADLRELFASSRKIHRPVLLDFFAPG